MTVNNFWPCVAFLGLLAGCATPEPKIVTQTVNIPVAESCVPTTLPAPPDYPDTTAALTATGVDGPRRYQLVVAGRALRDARLKLLEQIVTGCMSAGAQK